MSATACIPPLGVSYMEGSPRLSYLRDDWPHHLEGGVEEDRACGQLHTPLPVRHVVQIHGLTYLPVKHTPDAYAVSYREGRAYLYICGLCVDPTVVSRLDRHVRTVACGEVERRALPRERFPCEARDADTACILSYREHQRTLAHL